MIQPDEARRASVALREVVEQIDGGELEATKGERGYLVGAADALESAETE
jgi:hypothetical protein